MLIKMYDILSKLKKIFHDVTLDIYTYNKKIAGDYPEWITIHNNAKKQVP